VLLAAHEQSRLPPHAEITSPREVVRP
jgi:hypothetical protein